MSLVSNFFGLSDEQAMWRVQMHDDSQAFAQLLARWERPIQRLCFRMLADEHKAQDLTQEAFARIYSRRKEYQHGAKFSTFLWRVAVNVCLDEIRRIKRRRELTILPHLADDGETPPWEDLPTRECSPDQILIAGEQAQLVRNAMMQLPEHYRSVVVLRHYQDLKFREIAEVLGLPEGTVKSRMAEALTLLSRTLGKSAGGHPARGPNSKRNQKEALAL